MQGAALVRVIMVHGRLQRAQAIAAAQAQDTGAGPWHSTLRAPHTRACARAEIASEGDSAPPPAHGTPPSPLGNALHPAGLHRAMDELVRQRFLLDYGNYAAFYDFPVNATALPALDLAAALGPSSVRDALWRSPSPPPPARPLFARPETTVVRHADRRGHAMRCL